MEALLRLPRRASYADYLAAEQDSDRRHEFIGGVIVAMAGGQPRGAAPKPADGKLPVLHVRPAVLDRITRTGRYADGSIICGAPDHPAHDDRATTNPTVVIEVLSPSREGDDAGDKRSDFQSLASVEAYVLVAQDQRRVKVYRRVDGEWRAVTYRDGDSFELPTLTTSIPVADVYDGILDGAGRSLLRDSST
ncbi:MAG: Uma2 family endonuclease [Kofleriaceae bacterium]